MSGLDGLVAEFGIGTLLAIAAAALITSTIHGAVGVAGGLLMTGALALLIGVRASVPIMSIALIFSHGARSLMNLPAIDFRAFAAVMIAALPFIVLTSLIYVVLPVNVLAAILAFIIFTSIPMRHWAQSRNIKAGYGSLAAIGAVYGFFAGASIGSATILSPFLLGFGLFKEAFVATMAMISLSTNVIRIGVFSGADVLTSDYALLGVLVGLIMIPGNWIGRAVLRQITVHRHGQMVDVLAAVGGLNFFYLAITN
jgi:uncharacterized membrane protein YfcA